MAKSIASQIPNSKHEPIIISDIKKINASEKNKVINFLLASDKIICWSYETAEDWATDYNYLLRENII